MTYPKTEWKDRVVQKPRTYTIQDNGDGTITLIPAPGTVSEPGTPMSAVALNKIEQGVADGHAAIVTHAAITTAPVHGSAAGASPNTLAHRDANGDLTARRHKSTATTGTPPLDIGSTTLVPNLNAGMVDGIHFRTSNGYVEYDDGTGWKPVGGSGMYVASPTQQYFDATERTNSTSRYVLSYKFVPMFTGEIKVSADLRASGNGTGSQARLVLVAPSKASGGTIEHIVGGFASSGASLINYEMPIGTLIGNDLNIAPYHHFVALSNSSTTYANSSAIINVVERMPIYLLLDGRADAGAISNDCQIKNLKISYDVIRGG